MIGALNVLDQLPDQRAVEAAKDALRCSPARPSLPPNHHGRIKVEAFILADCEDVDAVVHPQVAFQVVAED